MNYTTLLECFLISTCVISCTSNHIKKEPVKIEGAYNFPIPKDWSSEQIPFPISFAPQIPFKGVEDLRFTPGWENVASDEHWAYAFVWYVDGNITLDTTILKKYLNQYYAGLLGRNVSKRHLRANELTTPTANIVSIKTEERDVETYSGTIRLTDYLDFLHPDITLNCIIHKKECNKHTAILIEILPQPKGHKIWRQLIQLEDGFQCKNNN